MTDKLRGIRCIVWDFDCTLYPFNPELRQAVRESEYAVIMDHTGWSPEKAKTEFYKLYLKKYASATMTTAVIAKIPLPQAAAEGEQKFDRRKYLKYDRKLVDLFLSLKSYRHIILTNGISENIEKVLPVIGLDPSPFERIITSEDTGVNKPDEKAFRYVLDYTGLKPEEHLMVGDREEVDIVTAKKLGLHTCLVWSEKNDTLADFALTDIYRLKEMLN